MYLDFFINCLSVPKSPVKLKNKNIFERKAFYKLQIAFVVLIASLKLVRIYHTTNLLLMALIVPKNSLQPTPLFVISFLQRMFDLVQICSFVNKTHNVSTFYDLSHPTYILQAVSTFFMFRYGTLYPLICSKVALAETVRVPFKHGNNADQ